MKENVIIGKLIPAGTGSYADRPMNHVVAAKAEELRKKREERNSRNEENSLMSFVNQSSMTSSFCTDSSIGTFTSSFFANARKSARSFTKDIKRNYHKGLGS